MLCESVRIACLDTPLPALNVSGKVEHFLVHSFCLFACLFVCWEQMRSSNNLRTLLFLSLFSRWGN